MRQLACSVNWSIDLKVINLLVKSKRFAHNCNCFCLNLMMWLFLYKNGCPPHTDIWSLRESSPDLQTEKGPGTLLISKYVKMTLFGAIVLSSCCRELKKAWFRLKKVVETIWWIFLILISAITIHNLVTFFRYQTRKGTSFLVSTTKLLGEYLGNIVFPNAS